MIVKTLKQLRRHSQNIRIGKVFTYDNEEKLVYLISIIIYMLTMLV